MTITTHSLGGGWSKPSGVGVGSRGKRGFTPERCHPVQLSGRPVARDDQRFARAASPEANMKRGILLADGDDKKERPFDPLKKEPDFKLDEKVTLRLTSDGGKTFPTVREGVEANRFKGDKGQSSFYLGRKTAGGANIRAKSEIVDDGGNVYVATEDAKLIDSMYLVRVTKKGEPKKP
jgi:hypothetical protein